MQKFIIGLFYLSVLLSVSCDNDDNTKTGITFQKISFSATKADNEEGIALSDYSTVKLLITIDEAGKAPAHYYVGKEAKTFDAGGSEFAIEEGGISIDLESASGEGKVYYVHQFDLDAEGKTSYRLTRVVSFNLKDKDGSKSVSLALVENKTKVEGETEPISETKEKQKTRKGKSKSKSSETTSKPKTKQVPPFSLSKEEVDAGKQFYFYVQFQKPLIGDDITYYKGTDKDISGISFKVIDENGTIYYKTNDFFGEISQGGKAADKFKITLPAEASIYENKTLIISGVSITIGVEKKTFTIHYDDNKGAEASSIQKGGNAAFIPPGSTSVVKKYVTIEDPNFRKYLEEAIPRAFNDKDEMNANSPLVKNLTEIHLHNQAIKTLDEVQYFTGLERLNCSYNQQLTSLDLAKNSNLIKLDCSNSGLTSLQLSGASNLTELDCSDNELKSLEVKNNTNLQLLSCFKNHIDNLDVTSNKALKTLDCYYNKLTVLNLIHNDKLNENNVTTDIGVKIMWYGGSITQIVEIPDEKFRSYLKKRIPNAFPGGGDRMNACLDEVKNIKVIELNNCKSLVAPKSLGPGIRSMEGLEYFTGLEKLSLMSNQNLTKIDVTHNTKLTELNLARCNLDSLDVSKNTALVKLYAYINPRLKKLDISHNTKLELLFCYNEFNSDEGTSKGSLTSLDVSKNPALVKLSCRYNQITQLHLENNKKLGSLDCDGNPLTELDVSNHPDLEVVNCTGSSKKGEVVGYTVGRSGQRTPIYRSVGLGNITRINTANCPKLRTLDCDNNQLKSLDVSSNTKLRQLSCNTNQLTSLHLNNNTDLVKLFCNYNKLKNTLDVSHSQHLEYLYCTHNSITVLYIHGHIEHLKVDEGVDVRQR